MHWICSTFLDLIDSYISQEHNPNDDTHAAAQKLEKKNWKFCLKTQIWKHPYKAIQVSKPIPLASWRIIGHNWIIPQAPYSKKREVITEIGRKNSKTVFHYPCIFIIFCCYVYVYDEVCKLIIWFNWSFTHSRPRYHDRVLGFAGLEFRAFAMREN